MSTAPPPGFSSLRQGRHLTLALLAGSLAVARLSASSPVEASAPKLVEWFRRWLGNPLLAAGGTRSPGAPAPPKIYLLHPWLLPKASPPQADLAILRRVLVATRPLRRIRLINDEGLRLGKATPPLSANHAGTRMAWPTHWPSLEPDRSHQLTLEGATPGAEASILLQAASEQDVTKAGAPLERLGGDSARWETTIQDPAGERHSSRPFKPGAGRPSPLLPAAPPSPALRQLRQALRRGACSSPSQAAHTPGFQQ